MALGQVAVALDADPFPGVRLVHGGVRALRRVARSRGVVALLVVMVMVLLLVLDYYFVFEKRRWG